MSAQSQQSDVEWLREQLIPPGFEAGETNERLAAIADALEAKDAEIASRDEAFLKLAGENKNRRHANEKLERELAATRAERDALAALVREAAPELKIMYPLHFEKWLARADEALRAPQTGGVNE